MSLIICFLYNSCSNSVSECRAILKMSNVRTGPYLKAFLGSSYTKKQMLR
jgi:hypothetical protein